MCGRYVVEIDEKDLQAIIKEAQARLKEGQINTGEIRPTNLAPVQILENKNMVAVPMRWGFPRWDGKGVIINARAETAANKKTFSKPLRETRVVVPTSGFFEWQHVEEKKKKDKYLFRQPGQSVLFLAGIYSTFDDEKRFNILTTAANESMVDYHDRMPVLLDGAEREAWLHGDNVLDVLNRTPMELYSTLTS